jgi:hypothetical protein
MGLRDDQADFPENTAETLHGKQLFCTYT